MTDDGVTTRYFLLFFNAAEPDAVPVGLARQVFRGPTVVAEETLARGGDWSRSNVFVDERRGSGTFDLVETDEAGVAAYLSRREKRLREQAGDSRE